MASFSFGAGNAAKLARLPLYAAGRLATLLIPRRRDAWVFGSGAGIGDGALALWLHARSVGHRMVWLTGTDREDRDAAAHGIPTVRRHSVRGFWRTARARVIVVTHGFGDVNRYAVSGAFIVQLWHGIPLKRIGIDAPETVRLPAALEHTPLAAPLRRVLAALYRRTTGDIDLIPAASHLVRGRLESAFSLHDEQVPVTGEPRVDVLSAGTPADRRTSARARVTELLGPIQESSRLVLYAPTWRDGAEDAAIPDARTWTQILAVLRRHDAILLIRSHPLGSGSYAAPDDDRVRVLGSDLAPDITALLAAMDVLITDYSSIMFDAVLVPVPTVCFAPDLDQYAASRGFYGTYAEAAGGDWATDWPGVLERLDAVLAGGAEQARRLEHARTQSARLHEWADGGSARRVHDAICARIADLTAKEPE